MGLIPLGILSSAGGGFGTYELIQTTILGSTTASVTFSGLAAYADTYKHLQIRAAIRSSRVDTSDPLTVQFNTLTSGFFSHNIRANDIALVSEYISGSAMRMGILPASSATANSYGSLVLDVLDVYSTTKNKTFRSLSGTSPNFIGLYSGSNSSTGSMTEIKLFPQIASFATGSRFSLYGIR
jgi:hypothetical protein